MGQSNDIQEKFFEVLKMCHDYSTWHSGVRTDQKTVFGRAFCSSTAIVD
jgi:hypothetical protein